MDKEYYYLKNGMKQGPFTLDALKKEPIDPDTLVFYSGLPDFVPARTQPELQAAFAGDSASASESNYNRREPSYNTSVEPSVKPQPAQPPRPAQTAFEAAGNTSSTSYNPNVQRPPMPENYLVWGIIVTICCCLPLGIVSIVNASKVSSAYGAGDYEGALKASKDAKKWAIWGAVGGGVFVVLCLIMIVAAAVFGMMDS